MGDGEVGNEFDIIFPHYRHDGVMLMSVTPHLIPRERRRQSDSRRTHARGEVSERQWQQRVLFINGAREPTNEA